MSFIIIIFKLWKPKVKTLTNKLTSSSTLCRLGGDPAATPRAGHLWQCQQPCQGWMRGERCLTFLCLCLVSLTQEIGLFHSSGSFTTFSWEAKGSRTTSEIWQLPKGNTCFAVEGGWRHALEKGTLSLWFSQGNRDQFDPQTSKICSVKPAQISPSCRHF